VVESLFGAYAGRPIATARRAFVVLPLVFAEPREFTPEDRDLMALLADSAAIAIEGAQLFEETEQRRRESEILAEIAWTINATLDLDARLQAALALDNARLHAEARVRTPSGWPASPPPGRAAPRPSHRI
jgi:GAF domain-containing protein